MYNNWRVDLSDSIEAFNKIKDTVLPQLISGRIYSIESTDNELLILFDQYSGIDWIRQDDTGLQGVATRCQFGHPFNTFTIRKQRSTGTLTEYEKRKQQISKGYIYPYFTLQAYFDNRKEKNLLSIAIMKTIDLYGELEINPHAKMRNSDNEFIYLPWENIPQNKIKCQLPVDL